MNVVIVKITWITIGKVIPPLEHFELTASLNYLNGNYDNFKSFISAILVNALIIYHSKCNPVGGIKLLGWWNIYTSKVLLKRLINKVFVLMFVHYI